MAHSVSPKFLTTDYKKHYNGDAFHSQFLSSWNHGVMVTSTEDKEVKVRVSPLNLI